MSITDYSIYLTNGKFLLDLVPTRVYTGVTSLDLQGEYVVPNYGQLYPTSLVHLLENFANTTPPLNPLAGQLWYNTTANVISVWSGTAWSSIGGGSAAASGTDAVVFVPSAAPGPIPVVIPIVPTLPTVPTVPLPGVPTLPAIPKATTLSNGAFTIYMDELTNQLKAIGPAGTITILANP